MLRAVLLTVFFFLTPFALLLLERASLKTIFRRLGLLPLPPVSDTLFLALKILSVFYAVLIVEAIVLSSIWDTQPVVEKLRSSPVEILILAVTLGPASEELFFRGFLQPVFGVVLTSLSFGLLHFGFDSLAEVIAATTASLVIGYFYKKNRNIYAAFLAHAFFNATSILLALLMGK